MSPESPSAACALHPTSPARATCERCGDYMCRSCEGETRAELCVTCESLVGTFPLRRESFELGEALSYAWERFTNHAHR